MMKIPDTFLTLEEAIVKLKGSPIQSILEHRNALLRHKRDLRRVGAVISITEWRRHCRGIAILDGVIRNRRRQ